MQKEIQIHVFVLVLVVVIAAAATIATTTATETVQAQILEKDAPTPIPLNGNATSISERDVAIDPLDGVLPANGTLSISMEGATDIDIQSMIPQGMTVVIDNQTATVTSHPVDIAVDESSDDP
jgi:hypothetical protein